MCARDRQDLASRDPNFNSFHYRGECDKFDNYEILNKS